MTGIRLAFEAAHIVPASVLEQRLHRGVGTSGGMTGRISVSSLLAAGSTSGATHALEGAGKRRARKCPACAWENSECRSACALCCRTLVGVAKRVAWWRGPSARFAHENASYLGHFAEERLRPSAALDRAPAPAFWERPVSIDSDAGVEEGEIVDEEEEVEKGEAFPSSLSCASGARWEESGDGAMAQEAGLPTGLPAQAAQNACPIASDIAGEDPHIPGLPRQSLSLTDWVRVRRQEQLEKDMLKSLARRKASAAARTPAPPAPTSVASPLPLPLPPLLLLPTATATAPQPSSRWGWSAPTGGVRGSDVALAMRRASTGSGTEEKLKAHSRGRKRGPRITRQRRQQKLRVEKRELADRINVAAAAKGMGRGRNQTRPAWMTQAQPTPTQGVGQIITTSAAMPAATTVGQGRRRRTRRGRGQRRRGRHRGGEAG